MSESSLLIEPQQAGACKALSAREKKLIACHSMYFGALAFGTYLIQKWTLDSNGGRINELVNQFAMTIVPWLLVFFLTTRFCHKIRFSYFFTASFIVCAVGYIVFFMFAQRGNTYLANILYGLIAGIGQGMFWSSFNNMQVHIINSGNKAYFYGKNGMLTQTANIVAPLIMLACVLGLGGNTQVPFEVFLTFFILLLICYFVAFVVSFGLKVPLSGNKITLKSIFRRRKNKRWSQFMSLCFLAGAFNSVPDVLSGVLILAFGAFKNYLYLFMLIISLLISVLSNYLFTTRFFAQRRISTYYVCVIGTLVIYSALAMLYNMSYGGYIAICVMALAAVLNVIRRQSEAIIHYTCMLSFDFSEPELKEGFFMREIFIIAGSTLLSGIMLLGSLWSQKAMLIITVSVCYVFASVLTLFIIRKRLGVLLQS